MFFEMGTDRMRLWISETRGEDVKGGVSRGPQLLLLDGETGQTRDGEIEVFHIFRSEDE